MSLILVVFDELLSTIIFTLFTYSFYIMCNVVEIILCKTEVQFIVIACS